MKLEQLEVRVGPYKRGLTSVTDQINQSIRDCGIEAGLVNIFCLHTSASLTITENADPDVKTDFKSALDRIVQKVSIGFMAEGADDMPAHVKSSLTDISLTVPLSGGKLKLGTWQWNFIFVNIETQVV